MTLSDMRTSLRANCFELLATPTWLTDTRSARFINDAMQVVANRIADSRPGVMISVFTCSPLNGGAWFLDEVVPTTRPYRLLLARLLSGTRRKCPIEDYENIGNVLKGAEQTVPTVMQRNSSFIIAEATATTEIEFHYVQALSDMVATTDTPGLVSGAGTTNLIPIEYHHLIVTYATWLALEAEGRPDADRWMQMYERQAVAALGTATQKRSSDQKVRP